VERTPTRLCVWIGLLVLVGLAGVPAAGCGCYQPFITVEGQLPDEPLLWPADGAVDVPADTWVVVEGELVGTTRRMVATWEDGPAEPVAVEGPELVLVNAAGVELAVTRSQLMCDARVLVILWPEQLLQPGLHRLLMEGEPVTAFEAVDQAGAPAPDLPRLGEPGPPTLDGRRHSVEVTLEHDGLVGVVRGSQYAFEEPPPPTGLDDFGADALPPPGETLLLVQQRDSGPPGPGDGPRAWRGWVGALGANGAFSGWAGPLEVELPAVASELR